MRKFPSFSWQGTYRSVLSCESPCGSSDRKATFAALTPTHCVRCLKPCPNLRFGAQASCESSPASAGKELTAPFCLANRLAALRTERQRSLTLTPTHCVRCLKPCPNLRFGAQASCESSPASAGKELTVPFCLANRLAALRTERQHSLTLTPAASPTLEALSQRACELRKVSCESSPASAGSELTAPFFHANRLAAGSAGTA